MLRSPSIRPPTFIRNCCDPSDALFLTPCGRSGCRRRHTGMLQRRLDAGRVEALCERMRHVQIKNQDAFKIIDRFRGQREALIYIDPPYRDVGAGLYEHGQIDHDALEALVRVAVSGYPGSYQALEAAGWERHDLPVAMSLAAGQHGELSPRVECLWTNYKPPARQPELWEAA